MSHRVSEFRTGTYSILADSVKWSIKFEAIGKFTITTNGELAVGRTYKVTGDELEVRDERGPRACGRDQKVGWYKWKLEGMKLTFTKMEDECEGRVQAMTSQGWEKE